MEYKIQPSQKSDVDGLTEKELNAIVKFKESEAYKILKKVGEQAIIRRAVESMETAYSDLAGAVDHGRLAGMKLGIDFLLDTPDRAKEALANLDED